MLQFTTDQWIIVALVFLLGLFIGGFIFSGGGRKWKHRYRERSRPTEASSANSGNRSHAEREKEWRERDSLRERRLKDGRLRNRRPTTATL